MKSKRDQKRIDWLREYRETQDPRCLTRLVTSFDKLIYKCAHRVIATSLGSKNCFDDLVQEGYEAVIKGIRAIRNDTYIVSYCALLIKSAQWKFVNKASIVDVKLDSISRKSSKKFCFKLSTIFDLLDTIDGEERNKKRRAFSNQINVPIEDIVEAEIRVWTINNTVPMEEEPIGGRIDSNIDQALLKLEINKAVQQLDEKHRVIIEERFFKEEPKTLRQLGKELGCDKLTVNARRKAGLKQLRKVFRNNQVIREMAA